MYVEKNRLIWFVFINRNNNICFVLEINNNEFQVRFLITGGLFQKDQNMIKYKN